MLPLFATGQNIKGYYKMKQCYIDSAAKYIPIYANQYQVPAKLIWATAIRESRLNYNAVGKAGEKGVGQFTLAACQYHKINSDSLHIAKYSYEAIAIRYHDIIYNRGAIDINKAIQMYASYRNKDTSIIDRTWAIIRKL